jgi:hypothetical protein
VKSIPALLDRGDMIAATTWSWEGVAASLCAAAIVETRVERAVPALRSRPPSLERVLAIGVRATRIAGWPVDVFIGHEGADVTRAPGPDRGGLRGVHGAIEKIDAPHGGRFHTRHEIAERVERGDVVGELGAFAVVAPVAGTLTALAARGARIEPSHPLAEIDPGGDAASAFGVTPETRTVAHRVAAALRNARDASSRSDRTLERRPCPPDPPWNALRRSAYMQFIRSPADVG